MIWAIKTQRQEDSHLRSLKNVACERRNYNKCIYYLSLHLPSSGLISSLLTNAQAF